MPIFSVRAAGVSPLAAAWPETPGWAGAAYAAAAMVPLSTVPVTAAALRPSAHRRRAEWPFRNFTQTPLDKSLIRRCARYGPFVKIPSWRRRNVLTAYDVLPSAIVATRLIAATALYSRDVLAARPRPVARAPRRWPQTGRLRIYPDSFRGKCAIARKRGPPVHRPRRPAGAPEPPRQ